MDMNADLVKANVSTIGTQNKPAAATEPVAGTNPASDSVKTVVPQQKAPSEGEVSSAVEDISRHVQNVQRNLSFTIDEDSGSTVVKVIDSASDEVIRQMPSEEILALRRRLSEMSNDELRGVLVQTKA
jgi:flagellar protein FlaG